MKLGKTNLRSVCRFCGSKKLIKFLDLGLMPHAGDYLESKDLGKEYFYPLKIYFCKKCGLVQILDIIPSTTLFKDYHYMSSVSLSEHFQKYAGEITEEFLNKKSFVVEIGSNDGVLLLPLKEKGINAIGVDPAKNIAELAKEKGLITIVDYFGVSVANKIVKKYGNADAILANNVLAHIDDMNDVFSGITKLLNKDGVLIFEVHYLPDLLKKMQYDFFYGEHLSYYSLSTLILFLGKYGLEIFDVKRIKVHSGSIRVYAKFKVNKKIKTTERVQKIYNKEVKSNLLNDKYLMKFAKDVYKHKIEMQKNINKIKLVGNKIIGYGAGGRANTFLNFCGFGNDILDYIVDDSPEREGKFTPGTHIPIVSREKFKKDKVKFVLLLAWNYEDQILLKEDWFRKNGGKFIILLPKIKII